MWTLFWDMSSGGRRKEKWSKIYIEAPDEEAIAIFYNRFDHNPSRVTCTCCGEDYSIEEGESLEQLSGYHRGCDYAYFNTKGVEVPRDKAWIPGKGTKRGYKEGYVDRPTEDEWRSYVTLDEYKKSKDVLIVTADEIKPEEREGDVPQQGYVWQD